MYAPPPALFGLLLGLSASESTLTATRDPVSQGIVGAIIVALFVLLALEKAHRVLIVFGAVGLLWLVTYLTPYHLLSFEAAQEALDLNVLLLLASMMAVVGVLKSTGVFAWAVARLLQSPGAKPVALMGLLSWFTAILSAFADNVTTVIFVTPMALEIAAATRVAPAAYLLPVVMAANIGGTATLIGDPPNILIGSGANLSFLDFILALAAPVFCIMLVAEWYSARYYRRELSGGSAPPPETVSLPPIRNRTLLRWGILVSGLIFLGFMTHTVTGMATAVPAAIGAAFLLVVQDVLYLRERDPSMHERIHGILHVIDREIEWPTLSFFALLFMVVGAAVQTGLIDTLAGGLGSFIEWGQARFGLTQVGTLIFAAILICWVSGILSAFIDNIPYVAVTIPIIATLTGRLAGDASVLWWALALGACLGGNGTMVGASANVTVVGLAEKAGSGIGFREFTRFGMRVAILSMVLSSIYLAAYSVAGPSLARIGSAIVLGFGLVARQVVVRRAG